MIYAWLLFVYVWFLNTIDKMNLRNWGNKSVYALMLQRKERTGYTLNSVWSLYLLNFFDEWFDFRWGAAVDKRWLLIVDSFWIIWMQLQHAIAHGLQTI